MVMNSSELDQLLRGYLEAKFGAVLDYFAIEGQMSPDAKGDMGVTGNYRKHASEKNFFFTATVNLTSRVVREMQEY
ncbi:MAG: hypothetical protein ABSF00_01165 [Candidatus Bathyarchaeia archaeon]